MGLIICSLFYDFFKIIIVEEMETSLKTQFFPQYNNYRLKKKFKLDHMIMLLLQFLKHAKGPSRSRVKLRSRRNFFRLFKARRG